MVGLIASFAMSGKQLGTYVWKNTEGRPLRRATSMCIAAMLATLLVLSWLPPAQKFRPIAPGERGTVQAAAVDTLPAPLQRAVPQSLTNAVPMPNVSPAPIAGPTPAPTTSASPESSPSPADASPSASPSASPDSSPTPSPS